MNADASPLALLSWRDALQQRLPARVQKLSVGTRGELLLELYAGEKCGCTIWLTPHGLHVVSTRSAQVEVPEKPFVTQALLRKAVVPSRLETIELDDLTQTLRLAFLRPDGTERSLVLELATSDPRMLLLGDGHPRRVLGVLSGQVRAKDQRDLRRGQPYRLPAGTPSWLPVLDALSAEASDATGTPQRSGARAQLSSQLKREAKRLLRLERALEDDWRKHGDPDELSHQGELLKANFALLHRGQTAIRVRDMYDEPVEVPLEPALDGAQNIDRIFKRARRAKEAQHRLAPRLEAVRVARAEVERLRSRLQDEGTSSEVVEEVDEYLRAPRVAASARRRAVKSGGRKPWRSFRASADVIIRVGRSAKDNDELTLHHARGNDLWVHTRLLAGSHVIVPLAANTAPAPEVLLDAAHLAAWFSPARGHSRADVQYTRRKHVKKPGRRAAPGFVHVNEEKVLHIQIDPARIERLLQNEVPA